jgi:hypothetical protein
MPTAPHAMRGKADSAIHAIAIGFTGIGSSDKAVKSLCATLQFMC